MIPYPWQVGIIWVRAASSKSDVKSNFPTAVLHEISWCISCKSNRNYRNRYGNYFKYIFLCPYSLYIQQKDYLLAIWPLFSACLLFDAKSWLHLPWTNIVGFCSLGNPNFISYVGNCVLYNITRLSSAWFEWQTCVTQIHRPDSEICLGFTSLSNASASQNCQNKQELSV